MSDLIDRQAAIDAFYKHPNIDWTTLDVMAEIKALPSAQLEGKMTKTLLNCPFCDKSVTVKIIPKEQNDNYVLRLVVKCKDCGVEMSKTMTNYPHYSIEYDADAVVDEISKLVDRWNRRG